MEVRIEINTEKNQVKKMISTRQLKACHNYECTRNRPITSLKHSENFKYLAKKINKPKLIKKSD